MIYYIRPELKRSIKLSFIYCTVSKHGIVISYNVKDFDLSHLDQLSVKTTVLYVPLQRCVRTFIHEDVHDVILHAITILPRL